MLSVYAKIGYIILLVLIVAFIVALTILAYVYERRERRRRTESIEALKERFGIVDFAQSGDFTRITLQTEAYGGTLRANSRKGHSFASIQFEGNFRVPKSSWHLISRRALWTPSDFGDPVELTRPELQKHFKLNAKRPEELGNLFDVEMEELLTKLDAGFLNFWIGSGAQIKVGVMETFFFVQIEGRQCSDEEHLRLALRLIERLAEYGQS